MQPDGFALFQHEDGGICKKSIICSEKDQALVSSWTDGCMIVMSCHVILIEPLRQFQTIICRNLPSTRLQLQVRTDGQWQNLYYDGPAQAHGAGSTVELAASEAVLKRTVCIVRFFYLTLAHSQLSITSKKNS